MNFRNVVFLSSLAILLTGCAGPKASGPLYVVNFPAVKLEPQELIENVEIHIVNGAVATVNRSLTDWDYDVAWESGASQTVNVQARHFLSGYQDLRFLDGFITVAGGLNRDHLQIEAVLEIGDTVMLPPGNLVAAGKLTRKIHVPAGQMILKPARGR